MQVLKEDVKQNIKTAAIECFREVGYEKASMREIAKRAKVSVGNLYRYFPNKEALFEYCVKPAIGFFEHGLNQTSHSSHIPFANVNFIEEMEVIETIFQARMVDRDALYLLLIKNSGSKFSGVKQLFIDYVEDRAKSFMAKEFTDLELYAYNDVYIKGASAAFVEGFLVILENAPDDQVFIRSIIQYMDLNVRTIISHLTNLRDNKDEFRRIEHEEIYRHFSRHCGDSSDNSSKSNGTDE